MSLKRGSMGTATYYADNDFVPPAGPPPGDTPRLTPEQRLQQLTRLREQDLITADEYARQRQAIIAAL